MILNRIIVSYFCLQLSNALRFDYYTGKIASKQLIEHYKSNGILDVCTTEIEPCCATEGRRVDGSCNCFDNPTEGTFLVSPKRVLPALYYNGSYPRKAVSGKDLLWPRIISKMLLAKEKTSDCRFTQAMTSYGIFMLADVGSIHDICMKEYMCTPNFLAKDDALNRVAGIQCWNLTRPLTHQTYGCTNASEPSPVVFATATFDLSQIYNFLNKGERAIRSYRGGRILMDAENGKTSPQKGADPNILVIKTLFVIWFVRLHNYFAAQLAIVNPCWDDDKIFYVARDMNIAYALEMYLYEWLASLQGYRNLTNSGVISSHPGFRNIYDPNKCPVITLEYTYILSYFYTAREFTTKLPDEQDCHLMNFPIYKLTASNKYLKKSEPLTQGHFRQPPGKADDHPKNYEDSENELLKPQKTKVDIAASELHKGRLLGLRPYIDYVYYCTGHNITCFEDLREHIDEFKIRKLQKMYCHVRDIDLLAGILLEKHLIGGYIPQTLACLLNDNLLKAITGDRHWYEYEHRPNAFTKRQLLEIRKANLAWMLCTVGDGVTKIQRNAFLTISPSNPLVSCSTIPGIDFEAWADPKCRPD